MTTKVLQGIATADVSLDIVGRAAAHRAWEEAHRYVFAAFYGGPQPRRITGVKVIVELTVEDVEGGDQ